MLQQRFFDNFYFFACGFYFLIKFFLFFVQFSVHFLFFTCFFLLQKKYCIFSIFYCCSPSHALDFVCFCFIFFSDRKLRPCDSWVRTSENVAAARWAQSRNFRVEKQVDGVLLVCVCVFVWMCDFCFALSVCCFSLHLYTHM